MEKNLVVVYEKDIAVPFLLKPMGNQVLLLSPGLELSQLNVEAQNWDNDDRDYNNNFESRFDYLCMTGETISANRMFELLMKSQNVGDEQSVHQIIETLRQWGVNCPYEAVNFKIDLSMVEINGKKDYKYSGDGFVSFGFTSPVYVTEALGYALKNVLSPGIFPWMDIEVKISDFSESGHELAVMMLDKVVGDEEDLHITFKTEED